MMTPLAGTSQISSYLAELSFQSDPSLADRLTLIDLLSHRTGLLRLDTLWLGANNEINIASNFTVAVCNHLSPVYSLRSQWLYNDWIYALVSVIIERVTHMPWGQVLAERVLQKANLSQTTVMESSIPHNSTASPYLIADDKSPRRVGDLGLTDSKLMSSAGGIRSTVHDMLIWGDILLSELRGNHGVIKSIDKIFSGHSFLNHTSAFDELYALGFAKVTTPAQFGKMGFNPSFVDTMPVIGRESYPIFYHNGALPGYNNCFMLIPSHQTVAVVLTNSISHGDTADWVAQALLQAVLDVKEPVDLVPFAERTAREWRNTYGTIAENLEKERIVGTDEPSYQVLVGTYHHTTMALRLNVFKDGDLFNFDINGKKSQAHSLSHYHYDTFLFLPSAEERVSRGLFHYSTRAWLVHFKRNSEGTVDRIEWILDEQAPMGEIFTKSRT